MLCLKKMRKFIIRCPARWSFVLAASSSSLVDCDSVHLIVVDNKVVVVVVVGQLQLVLDVVVVVVVAHTQLVEALVVSGQQQRWSDDDV